MLPELRPLLGSAVKRAAAAARAKRGSSAAVLALDATAVDMTAAEAKGEERASAPVGETEAAAGRRGLVTTVAATVAVATRCHVLLDERSAVLAAATAVAAIAVPVLPAVFGIAVRLTGDCWCW